MERTSIATEVVEFLNSHPVTGAQLAGAAGVNPVIISRLRTGKRSDVLSANADAIRAAIRNFRATAVAPTPPATSPEPTQPQTANI